MRTGCSQQAIVKTFYILPYMVKQRAIRSGLPYTENATPAHFSWKYTIKLELVLSVVFTTLASSAQIYIQGPASQDIFCLKIILSIT